MPGERGHVAVGAGFEACYRFTMALGGPGSPGDRDHAILVTTVADIPDPLEKVPGARRKK
jgi:hypothetical protein